MSRFLPPLLAALALAATVVAPSESVSLGLGPPQLYVSSGGSDGGRCTKSKPCRTLERAYEVANPGQTVELAAGRYPGQALPAKRGMEGKPVDFRPAPGGRVEFTGELTLHASNIMVERIHAPVLSSLLATNQTFRRLHLSLLFIEGSRNVRVLGGEIGPSVDADSQIKSLEGKVPRNILIRGVHFHDATKTGSQHIECLQIGAGINVRITKSRFERCSDHDIFIRSWGRLNGSASPLRSFSITQNLLAAPIRGHYSIRLAATAGWPCEHFTIARNTAKANMYSDCDGEDVRFLGNAQPSMHSWACDAATGTVWNGNVYGAGRPCGPGDRVSAREYRAALESLPPSFG